MPTPVHTQFGKFCGILPDLLYTRHKILTVNEFQCKSFEYILTFSENYALQGVRYTLVHVHKYRVSTALHRE